MLRNICLKAYTSGFACCLYGYIHFAHRLEMEESKCGLGGFPQASAERNNFVFQCLSGKFSLMPSQISTEALLSS